MARGKLKMKRCKNGTRRNKKTKQCEKRKQSTATMEKKFLQGIQTKSPQFQCKQVRTKKYVNRPSPSIPAPTCKLGTIKMGSDNKRWIVVKFRNSRRWKRV